MTSASGSTAQAPPIASRIAPTVSGFISEGVPPPKKTLVTRRPGVRAAIWAISRRNAATKRVLIHGLVPHVAVEVAIGALRGAERPMHIDAEARVPRRMIDHGPLMTASARRVTIRPCRMILEPEPIPQSNGRQGPAMLL